MGLLGMAATRRRCPRPPLVAAASASNGCGRVGGEGSGGGEEKPPIRWRKGDLTGSGVFGQVYLGMDLNSGKLRRRATGTPSRATPLSAASTPRSTLPPPRAILTLSRCFWRKALTLTRATTAARLRSMHVGMGTGRWFRCFFSSDAMRRSYPVLHRAIECPGAWLLDPKLDEGAIPCYIVPSNALSSSIHPVLLAAPMPPCLAAGNRDGS